MNPYKIKRAKRLQKAGAVLRDKRNAEAAAGQMRIISALLERLGAAAVEIPVEELMLPATVETEMVDGKVIIRRTVGTK